MSSKADIHSDDYYTVLGVKRDASDAEIAKAYKKLALKHHPDKNADRKEAAEEEFKRLTEAYEVLRCPEKRKVYDQVGKAGMNDCNPQSGDTDFFGGSRPGFRQSNMSREEADLIFRNLFGGGDPFSMFGGGDESMDGGSFMFMRPQGFQGFTGMDGGSFNRLGSFGSSTFQTGTSAFPRAGARSQSNSARGRASKRTRSAFKPHRASSSSHVVPNGTPIVIHGLTKYPEHNGKTGTIAAWDCTSERYEVQLRRGDDNLRLRPQNVTQLCIVEVAGLASKPELNGKTGEIFNYDGTKRRYQVIVDGAAISLQPGNCILTSGTRVTLDGLTTANLNGQRARILDIDRRAARYTVDTENGQTLKIKYENVLS